MTQGGLILVVDDDEAICQFVRMVLTNEGYRVETASNGAAALELAAKSPPDVILLDLWMPVMDGWTFARTYRRTPGPHAPIIALSAAGQLAKHAKDIQADAFLAKPFDVHRLLEVVERLKGAG